MSRKKIKDAVSHTFRIEKTISEKLEEYSVESMIPKTAIVEKAIKEYLDKMMEKKD